MEENYNGWENRETWAVKLHWDNNSRDQEYFSGLASEFKKSDKSVHEFSEELFNIAEEIFDSVIMQAQGTREAKLFVADVGSLWRVNWREIAQAYYDEVDE